MSKDERLDHFQLYNQENFRESSNRTSLERRSEIFQGRDFHFVCQVKKFRLRLMQNKVASNKEGLEQDAQKLT